MESLRNAGELTVWLKMQNPVFKKEWDKLTPEIILRSKTEDPNTLEPAGGKW